MYIYVDFVKLHKIAAKIDVSIILFYINLHIIKDIND